MSKVDEIIRKGDNLITIYAGGKKDVTLIISDEAFLDEQAKILGETLIRAWKHLHQVKPRKS